MSNNVKPLNYLEDSHLSKATKDFLKVLNAADKPVESLPVPDARNVLLGAQTSVDIDLSGIDESEKTITADGYTIKLNIVRPSGVKGKLPVFIFIHGGGWVLGDYPTHKRLVRDLVVESGYASVFVDYTLSPEAKFPQAVNEVFAATKWVASHGDEINVDGKRLAIVGNSAGGNMAAVTSLKAKENKGPEIKVQILLWPVTDAGTDYESFRLYGEQRFLTSSLLNWMASQYISKPEDAKSKYLSILHAPLDQLKGLPPTLIEVSENDILRDQGEAFGRKLDEAGVDVTTLRFNNTIHDWGMLNGLAHTPETKALITISAATLKKYLG